MKIKYIIEDVLTLLFNPYKYFNLSWREYIRKERIYQEKYEGLPRGCWDCELLGMCRRPKSEGWKCYNGCIIINNRADKRHTTKK